MMHLVVSCFSSLYFFCDLNLLVNVIFVQDWLMLIAHKSTQILVDLLCLEGLAALMSSTNIWTVGWPNFSVVFPEYKHYQIISSLEGFMSHY